MKNRAIILAILLEMILSTRSSFAHPTVVLAQTACYDARRQVIPCTPEPEQPQPEQEEKKKPTRTPVPPTKTATPTLTFTPTTPPSSTPSITPVLSRTPTAEQVLPIIPGGDIQLPATTHFPGGSGLLFSLLGLVMLVLLLVFVLKRAPRIYHEISEDSDLLFREKEPKGGFMPLATEIGFPDMDAHSKESAYMEINSPQRDIFANEISSTHLQPAEQAAPEPENYFEEEHASRMDELAPKKFPKIGDETDQDTADGSDTTGRSSKDDD